MNETIIDTDITEAIDVAAIDVAGAISSCQIVWLKGQGSRLSRHFGFIYSDHHYMWNWTNLPQINLINKNQKADELGNITHLYVRIT